MRSDRIKKGAERGPHRSLLKAVGLTDWLVSPLTPFLMRRATSSGVSVSSK